MKTIRVSILILALTICCHCAYGYVIQASENNNNHLEEDLTSEQNEQSEQNVQRVRTRIESKSAATSSDDTCSMLVSALAALNDPASIYFQNGPVAKRTIAAATSVLPYNSLRSILRRLYFGYLFYYPELRYGACLVRYVQNTAGEMAPTFEEAPGGGSSPQSAASSGDGLDEPAREKRSNEAAAANLTIPYAAIAEHLQTMIHRFVCSEEGGGIDGACARAHQSALTAPSQTLNGLDDATLRLYKRLALNVAERWMRSSALVRPVLSETGARRVRDIADVMLDGVVKGMRERLVPGLFGCTQHYFVEMLWRMVEHWL